MTSAYERAGVDIDAQDEALSRIKQLVRTTFTDGVLSEIGSFGGLFRPGLDGLSEPVLVASADGVGTKLRVAARVGDFSTVGRDLVNHCLNDILVQGARPLFFLDYVGAGRLEPDAMEALVSGLAAACRDAGCALLGGETAEMPGFYQPGDYELVGFIVGLVDRKAVLPGDRPQPGDVLVGLPSSGLHTNGYSLVRKIVFEQEGLSVGDPAPWEPDATVGDELLRVHRSYLPWIEPLLGRDELHGLAHVTGGGLTDNLPRILPESTHAEIRLDSWAVPNIFRWLRDTGDVDSGEMLRVFNMGVGMVAVVAPDAVSDVLDRLRETGCGEAWPVGVVRSGRPDGRGVVYRGGRGGAPG